MRSASADSNMNNVAFNAIVPCHKLFLGFVSLFLLVERASLMLLASEVISKDYGIMNQQ
jgi:hypothetical protein